jgi:hypothetical protein
VVSAEIGIRGRFLGPNDPFRFLIVAAAANSLLLTALVRVSWPQLRPNV